MIAWAVERYYEGDDYDNDNVFDQIANELADAYEARCDSHRKGE